MLNHFDARIKLRTVTVTEQDGYQTESVVETNIWADERSAKRSEFYAANAANHSADIVFVVNWIDYGGQTEIEYNGEIYTVIRSYRTTIDHVELTCEKKVTG